MNGNLKILISLLQKNFLKLRVLVKKKDKLCPRNAGFKI